MSDVMPGLILVIFFFIGWGLLQLFARDLMWDFAQWCDAISGRMSERTEWWDGWQTVTGVLCILLGVGLGLLVWHANGAVDVSEAQTSKMMATERASVVRLLDEDFADIVPLLEATASIYPQRVTTQSLGLSLEVAEMDYGRCQESDDFYMVVLNYDRDGGNYAYTSGERLCALDHLRLLTSENAFLGGSTSGGRWFELVSVVEVAGVTETPLVRGAFQTITFS